MARPGRSARRGLVAGAAAVGLFTAVTLPAPVGLQVPLIAGGVAAVAVRAARRPLTAGDRVLPALALALSAVGALRVSGWLVALCLLAALGIGALSALGGRDWVAVWATPAVLAVTGVRALPWTARGLRGPRLPVNLGPWVRGAGLTAVLLWVCGALLASADTAFAGLLATAVPDLDPRTLPVRLVLAGLVAGLTLTLAFAATLPPRWSVLRSPRRVRPAAEWLMPVLALDVLLGAFLVVQAAVLFGAYPEELVVGDATPAERARHGFGQLVLVTLLVLALLAWAGRRADPDRPRHRRLLSCGGGGLLVLVLVVVASALRRLWLYEETFGWTVLRLVVGVFEVWLGVVVVVAGVSWLLRRTAAVPRLVVGSAGVVLLGLGIAGPDAVVAGWNVDRFERTGDLDLVYARQLSDDAVPALSRLPVEERTVVLGGRTVEDGTWYSANLSRIRAAAVLRNLPS